MLRWHQQLNGQESEQAPGGGDGRGGLACHSPWGREESDVTKRLNNSNNTLPVLTFHMIPYCLMNNAGYNFPLYENWGI